MTHGIDLKPIPPTLKPDPYVGFSNRARRSQKRTLTVVAKRTFKSEQYHLEKALAAYFASLNPDLLLPIPEDE